MYISAAFPRKHAQGISLSGVNKSCCGVMRKGISYKLIVLSFIGSLARSWFNRYKTRAWFHAKDCVQFEQLVFFSLSGYQALVEMIFICFRWGRAWSEGKPIWFGAWFIAMSIIDKDKENRVSPKKISLLDPGTTTVTTKTEHRPDPFN